MNKREVGSFYEKQAAEYLKTQGYVILAQNFYTHFGEIDIVAREGRTFVFVEVKYRKNSGSGYPQEAVTARKKNRMIQSAKYYLYRYGNYDREDMDCRFDVIAILGTKLTHIKHAFEVTERC